MYLRGVGAVWADEAGAGLQLPDAPRRHKVGAMYLRGVGAVWADEAGAGLQLPDAARRHKVGRTMLHSLPMPTGEGTIYHYHMLGFKGCQGLRGFRLFKGFRVFKGLQGF
jgi:hypothetical protein